MDWQATGLIELCLAHGQARLLQINVSVTKMQGFGDSESGGCNDTEQRLVGCRPQAALRRQTPGFFQQIAYFLICVDVRRQPPMTRSEELEVWHHAGRLELAVVRRKWPNDLQPS